MSSAGDGARGSAEMGYLAVAAIVERRKACICLNKAKLPNKDRTRGKSGRRAPCSSRFIISWTKKDSKRRRYYRLCPFSGILVMLQQCGLCLGC